MLNCNLPADAQILPFYLADGSDDVALIRGRMASVGRAASTILARHAYPEIVAILQAEALALAACLSSTLKFNGTFTIPHYSGTAVADDVLKYDGLQWSPSSLSLGEENLKKVK